LNLNEIQHRTKTVVGLYHQRLTARVAELAKNVPVDPNRLALRGGALFFQIAVMFVMLVKKLHD